MISQVRDLAIIMIVSASIFFINLGGPRLWDRDEPRNAGCTVEMLAASDWVVPQFNAEVRDHKPVLLYWLMMVSYWLFGISEFSARFPSAVLSLGSVFLTYAIGKRLFNSQVALFAGIILSSNLMFTIAARAATPDALLIFCVVLSMWLYVFFTFNSQPSESAEANSYYPEKWWQISLIYTVMGLGVLAKGPVGLILPTAIIGMFLLIMRLPQINDQQSTWQSWFIFYLRPFTPLHFFKTCLFMRPVLAILSCSLVALPWYIWVAMRDYSWIEGFFITHNFSRATTVFEGHAGPPYFYLLAIAIGFFPWSIFYLPVILETYHSISKRIAETPALIFLSCWLGVWVGIFSLASTKLPSYVTPVYPALALLTGFYLHQFLTQQNITSAIWYRIACAVLLVTGIGFTVSMPFVADRFLPGEETLAAIGMTLILGGIFTLVFRSDIYRKINLGGLSLTAALFILLLTSVAAHRVSLHQKNHHLITKLNQLNPQAQLFSFSVLEPSWVFYSRKPIKEFGGSDAELSNWAENHPEDALFITGKRWNPLKSETKEQFKILATEAYFLRDDQLFVLVPRSSSLETAEVKKTNQKNR